MSDETTSTNGEARKRIDAYLDAIDRVLAGAGMSRSERRNVTDDVETQIQEMLAARGSAQPPAIADVEAVLSQLDPPEAYASPERTVTDAMPAADATPPCGALVHPRLSRTAMVGALWAPFFFVAWVSIRMARSVVVAPGEAPPGPTLWQYLALIAVGGLGLTAPFGTTALGIAAISQIRNSGGRLYGLALAVFDALLYPLLALDVLICVLFLATAQAMAYQGAGASAASLNAIWYRAIAVAIVADVAIAICLWRTAAGVAAKEKSPVDEKTALLGKVALAMCLGGMVLAGLWALVALRVGVGLALPVYLVFLAFQVAAFVLGLLSLRDPMGKAAAITSVVLAAGSLLTMA